MPILASIPASAALNTLSSTHQAQLEQLVSANLDAEVFPAVSLTAIRDGEVRINSAWGYIDPETCQHPTQPDTLFDLASITKPFTITALHSTGVPLETPLGEIIPEFVASGPRPIDGGMDPHEKHLLPTPAEHSGQMVDPAQITLRHLVTHSSGLSPWRDVFNAAGPAPTPPDEPDPISRAERWARAVTALCGYPFVSPPDGIVRYSDVGLMLLGEAVSRLHGTPGELDRALAARMLEPLGLSTVTYNPVRNGHDRSRIAPTEDDPAWRGRRVWGEVHDENACGVGGVAGHAGLFAAARDVAALGQAWLENDPRLGITPGRMDAAKQQHARNGFRFGLGWMLRAESGSSASERFSYHSFGHTGFTGTSLWIDPEQRLVVACLTNSVYPGRGKEGTHDFRRALHALLAEAL